jgi:hypothetical protein
MTELAVRADLSVETPAVSLQSTDDVSNLQSREYESNVTAMMITPLRNGLEETPGAVVPLWGLTLVCD